MHLLKLESNGKITRHHFYESVPRYAILSHRWIDGIDAEPTYQDITNNKGQEKPGYKKLIFCGKEAQREGIQYFWADTVCIDKSSSAELTEALNSMFLWYKEAWTCIVYLQGVTAEPCHSIYQFRKSERFTRGWTLQEVLASQRMGFFTKHEHKIGGRWNLQHEISDITGIPVQAILGQEPLQNFSVAERMSWVAKRETTREEDKAYCMMGIFNVFMPVIYGGRGYAMQRLRDEIRKRHPGAEIDAGPEAARIWTESEIPISAQAAFGSLSRALSSDSTLTGISTPSETVGPDVEDYGLKNDNDELPTDSCKIESVADQRLVRKDQFGRSLSNVAQDNEAIVHRIEYGGKDLLSNAGVYAMVLNDVLASRAVNVNDYFGGDPFPGQVKTAYITYQWKDQAPVTVEGREGTAVNLGDEVRVFRIEYGGKDLRSNSAVGTRVVNDILAERAVNINNNCFGGDPLLGQVKTAQIIYQWKDYAPVKVKGREGTTLTLGPLGAEVL